MENLSKDWNLPNVDIKFDEEDRKIQQLDTTAVNLFVKIFVVMAAVTFVFVYFYSHNMTLGNLFKSLKKHAYYKINKNVFSKIRHPKMLIYPNTDYKVN